MTLKKRYQYPLYILSHPTDGYEELCEKDKWSKSFALLVLTAWFIADVLGFRYTGFIFNENDPDKLNIFMEAFKTWILFFLWVIANWAICTLLDGKGSIKKIWIGTSYALLPYVILKYMEIVLSQFMIRDESVFLSILGWIGILWSFYLYLICMMTIHEYSFWKTLVSVFLNLLGLVIILFLALLSFGLYMQVYEFFQTLYSEIAFRLS